MANWPTWFDKTLFHYVYLGRGEGGSSTYIPANLYPISVNYIPQCCVIATYSLLTSR